MCLNGTLLILKAPYGSAYSFHFSQRRGCIFSGCAVDRADVSIEVKTPTTLKFTLRPQGRSPCCSLHLSHLYTVISNCMLTKLCMCKSSKTLNLRGLIHSDLRYKVCSPDSNGRDAKTI